jgi:ribosome-associated translation inhibitor RaiA|tara:strand:+ start:395 stop:2044 length:1650 start_codon:yes stop_codon:yes gene_type:complete
MATFQAQVEDLTSISVSDTDELTQFLKDGVLDVTARCLAAKPQEIQNFQRESATIDSNGGLDIGGAQIISVIREAGADGTSDGSTAWRQCQQISAALQSRVVDTESLHFASQYNPKYMIDDNGKVNVYPVASSNNGYKVFFVNNIPTDETNETALIHSDSDIKWFPNEKIYLVVMYASVKLLQATMGDNVISISTIAPVSPGIDILKIEAVPPIAPAIEVSSVTITGSAPTYIPPVLAPRTSFEDFWTASADTAVEDGNPFGDNDPGAFSISSTAPIVPSLSPTIINESGLTAPTFIAPVMSAPDFNDTNTWITTEEDSEMLASRIQEIQAKIGEYSARMQESQAQFAKENTSFQADLQIAIQNAQLESAEDGTKLQKYGSELATYQADVAKEVQEYGQKLARYQLELNTAYTAWGKTESDNIQVFQSDIQNQLNKFNTETSEYQSILQKDTADAQFVESSEARKLQKYSAEIQVYQGLVNVEVQEFTNNLQSLMTRYQAETAAYQAEVAAEAQEQSTKMQQYQLLYTQLKADYEGAFAAMYPRQQSAA